MDITLMEARPPYARWEQRPIEQRDADGNICYATKDFVLLTAIGSKDCHEREVQDWFRYLAKMEGMDKWPRAWTERFRAEYEAWKKGQEIPREGTPIANWPVATKAEVTILRAIHILTVEDLAVATEEALSRIGMGARSLKQRAQDWITSKKDTAPLVARLDALESTNKQLLETVETLKVQNQMLQSSQQVGAKPQPAVVEDPLARVERLRGDSADKAIDDILE